MRIMQLMPIFGCRPEPTNYFSSQHSSNLFPTHPQNSSREPNSSPPLSPHLPFSDQYSDHQSCAVTFAIIQMSVKIPAVYNLHTDCGVQHKIFLLLWQTEQYKNFVFR